MSAVPDDAAALKHQNARRHADGAEAVGYDESRPSLHQAVQLLLDLGLAFRVQGGGGFIQNQDGGVFQEGAGNRHALALAAGQAAASVAKHGLVAVRHPRPIRAGAGLSYGAMKEIMERHRPDSCVAMPVQLLSTLRVCGRGTLRSALVSGDSCPAPIAGMIEGILGSRLFHHYGTREMGLGGAVTCPAHEGMHIRENHVIAEIIDDGGRPAALGSPGELVITTIGMEAMPLIRYRTGDRARLMEGRCPCSSSLMRLDTDISRLAGGDAASSAVLKDDRIADYGPEKDGDGIRVLTIGRYDCAKFIKGIFGRQIEVTARPVTMEDAPMYAGKRAPLA